MNTALLRMRIKSAEKVYLETAINFSKLMKVENEVFQMVLTEDSVNELFSVSLKKNMSQNPRRGQ
ncbi:MAG: hypothetical protein K1000chlam3_01538 [Chlamydiae bacterium]|nr:hypothetical protein [Chlamydiota bacterium]